jgi:hypothetical protein
LGDKAHSVVFDNSKLKRLVPEYCAKMPFWRGAREIVEFYAEHPDFEAHRPDVDDLMDSLVEQIDSI